MEKKWILLLAVLIFGVFTLLFKRLGNTFLKKVYGTRTKNHWPTKLYNWQAAIFYGVVFTAISMFLLKWTNVLTF